MCICTGIEDFDLQDGGGPPETFSRATRGPRTMSSGNSALN
jgi:hypothetical protein